MKHSILPLILALCLSPFAFSDDARPLFDFDKPGSSGSWRSINDSVMGGVSKGGFRVENGQLVFSGALSLENNGGFASIRTGKSRMDLSGYKAFVIRVRGDGRQYSMNIGTTAWIPAGSYWSKFQTTGKWQEIRLPFSTFKATAFGRPYPLAGKYNPARTRTIGFTIADKKAGAFRLEVDWIRAAGDRDQGRSLETSPVPMDIVDIAVDAGSFKTLVAAVKAAGLVETLKSEGPFTVFAPTDEAFAKLPKGALKDLLLPENKEKLGAILKFHVVPGRLMLGSRKAKTVLGDSLTIAAGKGLSVNGASIVKTDIEASNGVIHVIDRVLLPKAAEPDPRASAMKLIRVAVERGAPLYNDGKPDACYAIYEVTARGLLNMPANVVCSKSRSTLKSALEKAEKESNARSQAWTLRHALDAVYSNLKNK